MISANIWLIIYSHFFCSSCAFHGADVEWAAKCEIDFPTRTSAAPMYHNRSVDWHVKRHETAVCTFLDLCQSTSLPGLQSCFIITWRVSAIMSDNVTADSNTVNRRETGLMMWNALSAYQPVLESHHGKEFESKKKTDDVDVNATLPVLSLPLKLSRFADVKRKVFLAASLCFQVVQKNLQETFLVATLIASTSINA